MIRGLFGLLVLGVLAGCADDSLDQDAQDDADLEAAMDTPMAPVMAAESITADKSFADTVTVGPDTLTVPTAGNEAMIAKIKEGSILAGDRASSMKEDVEGPNDLGFLRRIVSIKVDGANTVFTTTPAELDEWIGEGDLDYTNGPWMLDPTNTAAPTGGITTQTLHLQDDNESGKGGSTVNLPALNTTIGSNTVGVRITGAGMTLGVGFDGYIKVRKKKIVFAKVPTGVDYRAHLLLHPQLQATLSASFTRSVTLAEQTKTFGKIKVKIPGTIPLTVELSPQVVCSASASGTVSASVTARVGARADIGVQGYAGIKGFKTPQFIGNAPTLEGGISLGDVSGKASFSAKCKLLAVPAVVAFDSVKLEGKIGPYVSLNADVCQKGMTVYESHGLTGNFNVRLQLPVVHIGKTFDLVGVSVPLGSPSYFRGSADTCSGNIRAVKASAASADEDGKRTDPKDVDSCNGKKDGFYCSEVVDYGGFLCEDGQIAYGMQCNTDEKCTGGTKDKIECK